MRNNLLIRFFHWLGDLLHRPARVAWICVSIAFINLILDGSLFQLWSLHRDFDQIQVKSQKIIKESKQLDEKIARASDPSFIEREAREKLELVDEGDLVFVFTDDSK